MNVIDSSLAVLGGVASAAFRFSFKFVEKKDWPSIVDDTEPLEKHLKAVFSGGSSILIEILCKNICREFSLEYKEGMSLTDYAKEALG